ncbi:MAG: hypothetical protein IPL49_20090 [Saprospirales bacterium]|nr:hypothetical protein [Saprospirales bacterium]MBK8493114.1 hypothetical protein [Saprospirales bacterium]
MNNIVLTNVFRFLGLLLFQGLILRRIEFDAGVWSYIHILVYPLFIFLLPLRTPRPLVIFSAFAMGILVDLFYYSPGIHASTATFLGFIRPQVLSWLEPRGGYNVNFSPTRARFGDNWFLRYSAILLAIHLFFYFSVEAFTFVFIGRILLNTLMSFVLSFFFIFGYMRVFDPLD